MEITVPMKALMKRLPTNTFRVPPNLRVFSKLEDAGLAKATEKYTGDFIWYLTEKGEACLKKIYEEEVK